MDYVVSAKELEEALAGRGDITEVSALVYLADDLKHERRVALKVLKPELAAVVGAERFLAEIKTTANLTTKPGQLQTISCHRLPMV